MKRLLGAMALALALVGVTAPPALGAAPSVTLSASASIIAYGETVAFNGQISPPGAGETVDVVDGAGTVLAQATTDATGAFSVSLAPQANVTVHAAWQNAASPEVSIGVRVVLTVRLGAVRLFDRAVIRGTVAPAHPGARVEVTLVRAGVPVVTRNPTMGTAGGFRTTLPVEEPGTYRVRASFADADHVKGTAVDGPRSTPLPSLRVGSSGVFVRLLERRLVQLHYRLVAIDQTYDFRTGDAVLAFRKVQGMPRVFTVDAAVWRTLADPLVPRPRSTTKGFHIEIDQTRQVLYTVHDGSVTNIIHVSSGKPSTPTRDGTFRVFSKLAGFSSKGLYYPSFFDGGRAIHGWTEVPTYAASHGCVRVPYWNARWIYGLAVYGTAVIIHH